MARRKTSAPAKSAGTNLGAALLAAEERLEAMTEARLGGGGSPAVKPEARRPLTAAARDAMEQVEGLSEGGDAPGAAGSEGESPSLRELTAGSEGESPSLRALAEMPSAVDLTGAMQTAEAECCERVVRFSLKPKIGILEVTTGEDVETLVERVGVEARVTLRF